MIDLGLEALLVMDKAGIPLLFQKFDPKRTELEPVLLSGFLTAVKEFSLTVIDDTMKDFHIDYGKRLVTIISGKKILFAAIHNQKSTQKISPVLTPLLEDFEENYYSEKEIGESGPLDKYEPFREKIFSILGISNPSLEWIPFLSKNIEDDFKVTCKLDTLIDNQKNIQQIIQGSNCSKTELLKELSRLWAYGLISFRNVLTEKDIVISTNKITNYLQSNSIEWREVVKKFTNLASNIPFIISHFDGKTTVGQILEEFSKEGIENLYNFIDYLYINDAIAILSAEKRRILMAKEILQASLEIAVEMYSMEAVLKNIKSVLKEVVTPEIISQIKITDTGWTIDYSFIIYDGLTPEKILELYDRWLEILRLFIFSLQEKKLKKFIETLTEELDFEFFEKYRSEDMDGFEEFAFWLELIFN